MVFKFGKFPDLISTTTTIIIMIITVIIIKIIIINLYLQISVMFYPVRKIFYDFRIKFCTFMKV